MAPPWERFQPTGKVAMETEERQNPYESPCGRSAIAPFHKRFPRAARLAVNAYWESGRRENMTLSHHLQGWFCLIIAGLILSVFAAALVIEFWSKLPWVR
jgi:hypothetical protein